MKRAWRGILMLSLALGIVPAPLTAHHSFASQFDANKKIVLKGTVTKVEWENPHIWFYVDVKDDAGKIANWAIEGGSPNGLLRNGFTKNTLKLGDEVTVEAFQAKDGSNLANVSFVTVGGKKVLARNPGPEGLK
jgi:hypothetical protein